MNSGLQTINNDLTKLQLSGYQLTTQILRNGKVLDLKSSEVLVLSTLATYWNGKPVYPRIALLVENTALSEKAVRTNLNSLITKGYIIKAKRGRNANVYNINVSKVISTIESGKNDRISAVDFTAPCTKSYHEKLDKEHHQEIKQKQTTSNSVDDDFSSNSSKKVKHQRHITLEQVPDIIKNNPKVKKACAYWASLSEEEKKEQWEEDKKQKEKVIKLEKKRQEKKEQEARKKAEEKENKRICSLPLEQQYTKEQALSLCLKVAKMGRGVLLRGITAELIKIFSLDIEEIVASAKIGAERKKGIA